jgi:thymidylate synthase
MANDSPEVGIPTISLRAQCLPEAWEKAVLAVWEHGIEIKSQYDQPDDLPCKDAMVGITVTRPLAEPRIHKNFPGGPAELEAYRQEVVNGIHDHWINGEAGKWTYTYHQRLFAYPSTSLRTGPTAENGKLSGGKETFPKVNQIEHIIETLVHAGYSRRAQAITWIPSDDIGSEHPPCLQRIWCRISTAPDGRQVLNMNAHWRSRDLYKAWFMNAYALTDLQKIIAQQISAKITEPVVVGRYVDITDSLHIYGRDLQEAGLEVKKMRQTPFTQRAWESTHPAFEAMTQEAREKLAQDPDWFAKARG